MSLDLPVPPALTGTSKHLATSVAVPLTKAGLGSFGMYPMFLKYHY